MNRPWRDGAAMDITPFPDRRSELAGLAGSFGHAGLFCLFIAPILAGFGLPEAGLGATALAVTLFFFRQSLHTGRLAPRFPVLAWLAGQNLAWVIGFLGYLYLPKPEGFEPGREVFLSMVLANLAVLGAAGGSLLALPPRRQRPLSREIAPLPGNELVSLTCIFGAASLVYGLLSLASGGLMARWMPMQAGGLRYFLDPLIAVVYAFYFFLGAGVRPLGLSRHNAVRFLLLGAGLVLTGFSGGRAFGLRMLIYFLAGMLFSPIPLRRIASGLAKILPLALAFTFVIGAARGGTRFGEVGLTERLDLMLDALTGNLEAEGELQNYPVFAIFERLATPQGQTVIDDVAQTNRHLGMINSERALTIFAPKILAPDKKSPDDGYERLIEHHNFRDEPGSTAPITFMADAFERGGWVWVFFLSAALGLALTLIGRGLTRPRDPCLASLLLLHFAILCLEMYPRSVLGTFSAITYGFLRDMAVMLAVALSGIAVIQVAGQARNLAFTALAKRLERRP